MNKDKMRSGIRPAHRDDVAALHALIVGLAEYEHAADEVKATEADLRAALFASSPAVFADVAEHEGEIVGMALWFRNYSTWTGRHGIYLEDLFVRPEHRGRGYGRALLAGLARRCVDEGLTRLEWSVLDWNEPALGFYRALGAVALDEWTVHRLSGEALARLASS
jgi:GNAT superfamily N-acetyltransferase